MATKIVFHPLPPPAAHVGRAGCWNALRPLALVIGLFLCSISARAQLQQPLLFSGDPANLNASLFTPETISLASSLRFLSRLFRAGKQ